MNCFVDDPAYNNLFSYFCNKLTWVIALEKVVLTLHYRAHRLSVRVNMWLFISGLSAHRSDNKILEKPVAEVLCLQYCHCLPSNDDNLLILLERCHSCSLGLNSTRCCGKSSDTEWKIPVLRLCKLLPPQIESKIQKQREMFGVHPARFTYELNEKAKLSTIFMASAWVYTQSVCIDLVTVLFFW